MPKKQAIPLTLLVVVLLCFTLSTHTANARVPEIELIKEHLRHLPHPPAGQTAEWTLSTVRWILHELNISAPPSTDRRKVDPIELEKYSKSLVDALKLIVDDPLVNPYPSLTKGTLSFSRIFAYKRKLDRGEVDGGVANPVYGCYKGFWNGCYPKDPQAVDIAVVYNFDCAARFYDKCELLKWWRQGKWGVPNING
ncbi:hypothetical protein HPP92_024553 [Vanilla planifolia]|uniref:Uncharacterized protein n=1 Tax=Vanilla planifolia TaxID=51239 RepID=A0A835UDD6_VANPL|nr:hypothetical protein HPP92_024553 [Vanilla planifolia]